MISPNPTPERKNDIIVEPSKGEKELIPAKPPKINLSTPESRLREDRLREEWMESDTCKELKFNLAGPSRERAIEYRKEDVFNWFLFKLSQERELLVVEIEGLKWSDEAARFPKESLVRRHNGDLDSLVALLKS